MGLGSARVLIVDDDADIRSNFSDILGDLGYQTTTAHDGESALECVRENRFDVVLLDYKMPGMDGAALYQEIKKLRPSIVAIMITAWAGSDGAQKARSAGTWDVLRKPVDIPVLLEKLSVAANAPYVLVVDDDKDFCRSLWEILNEKRFRVALAHDEEEGIARANDTDCQFAIVDLKLGEGDGRNVIRRISKAVPGARTVVVSGDMEFAITTAKELGESVVHDVFAKPLDVDRLLQTIDTNDFENCA